MEPHGRGLLSKGLACTKGLHYCAARIHLSENLDYAKNTTTTNKHGYVAFPTNNLAGKTNEYSRNNREQMRKNLSKNSKNS